ncbi:uncharacterized protein LOC134834549 [Culicoides brevitarsis]|uniref:uncharacterized protein LOC134834549 n=1 Tax=Culicoides brevitarsis TaxID=469753 RepID=UPI00307C9920
MEYNENLCRLCLEIDFDAQNHEISMNVINALKDIFKIRLLDSSNETLPRHLCSSCSTTVSHFYSFYIEKMANQTKLLLGLEKFGLAKNNVSRTFDENDSDSTISIDESQFDSRIVKEDERCNSNIGVESEIQEQRSNAEENSIEEVDSQSSIHIESDDESNLLLQVTKPKSLVDSYDTLSTFTSQETYVSDDFANDPTYTPSESMIASQSSTISSSSNSKSTSNEEITQNETQPNSQESRDSDVEITGVISALHSAMKRKLSQPSILNYFAVKKEKIEVRRNKITNYFGIKHKNIDLKGLE